MPFGSESTRDQIQKGTTYSTGNVTNAFRQRVHKGLPAWSVELEMEFPVTNAFRQRVHKGPANRLIELEVTST